MKYSLFLMLIIFSSQASDKKKIDLIGYKNAFSEVIKNSDTLPDKVEINESSYDVEYSLNPKLETSVKKILNRYKPDFGSVVVLDNDTGNILTAVDFTREGKKFSRKMCFSSDHPAASVFKVITAATLFENTDIDPNSTFSYRGKGSTLYKYQLKNKIDRWSRRVELQKAFAYSNNVILAKATINNSNSEEIFNMAQKFKFHSEMLDIFPIEQSLIEKPGTEYRLAEIASGFNKITKISPFHGAVITSIIANNGVYKKPSFVSKISREKDILWLPNRDEEVVIKKDSAKEIQEMMELTVKKGTARSLNKYLTKGVFKNLTLGGKTGSITGGQPFGKRDWFVIYAKPKSPELGNGISVAVMLVNVKKWYVKSTWLAKNIIEYYYQDLFPLRNSWQNESKK